MKIFLGKAVQDGRLRFLSVSAIEKFATCERWWGFRYVDGIKEPESKALETGNKVHAEIEHYLKTGEDVLGPIARAGKHLIYPPGGELLVEHESLGELVVCGVPLYMKLDVENSRGYYLDAEGRDRPLDGAVEVNDWKTTSDMKWAKTGRELLGTVQMPVYGKWALERPRALPRRTDVVRLSHTYFGTRRREAGKATVLAKASEIGERWGQVEQVVERMIQAADVATGAELQPNWDACGRCPHRDRCPQDAAQALAHIFTAEDSAEGEEVMTFDPTAFLNQVKNAQPAQQAAPPPTPQPAPAAAPQPPAPSRAAIEAQLAVLQAQLAATQPPPAPPAAAPQPNVYLTGPQAQQYGQATGQDVPPGAGVQTSHAAAVAAGVLPGDAPPSGATGPVAKPLAPEAVLAMPPPIQAAHAALFPPAGAPPIAPPPAAVAPLPAPVAPLPQAAPPPAEQAAAEKPKRARRAKVSAAGAAAGLSLYVDCVSEGVDAEPLDDYVQELCDQLCAQFKAVDIRCPGDDTPLAFGKWKGVLAGFVRARPPKAGSYYVMVEGSEIKQVVVEALRPICGVYVRGVR